MKKTLIFFVAFAMLITLPLSVHATSETNNIYEIGNVTVIFDENTSFDFEKQQQIANYIVNPEYGVSTAGLMCTLFGHKNTSETVTTITHKAKDNDPRCLEEIFAVTSCSRCDETSIIRTAYGYISCCPEE